MRTNFLDFVNNMKEQITEAFNVNALDKVEKKITELLKKHISGLIPLTGYVNVTANGDKLASKQYIVIGKSPSDVQMFQLNWKRNDSSASVYSIDFFDSLDYAFDGKGKSKLSIYTLGSSIVNFLPVIWTVVNSKKYDLSDDITRKLASSIYKESYDCYIGALKYKVFENLTIETIRETFKLVCEAVDKNVIAYKKKKQEDAHNAYLHKNDSEEAKNRFKEIDAEYKEVKNAIAGGATTIEDLKFALKHNVNIIAELENGYDKADEKIEQARKDPQQVFKELNAYVKLVINGINPSVILCGAPGVGKTYRVKTLLKAAGYHEGHNMCTIKGKCSPRMLYLTLYEYQDKGCITVIDDADGLVGPHAPEDCINILKAALDSTSDDEGRLVSYGVSGKILDDDGDPVPKKFYYNGGIIVITNWNAGKLDTALRGRSYIQDIHFSTEDLLEIVKSLMPTIDPEHLSMKSKEKAYQYLIDLHEENSEMEISIRTFGICAKIFEAIANDDEYTDDDAKSMIKEQMRLQSLRISGKGGKY